MAGLDPRLSGWVFVDKVHGVDSSASRTSGNVSGQQRANAMPHKNSVFHGILKHVPWAAFERLVQRHEADVGVRTLDSKTQLIALLYGQFSGAKSLREIVDGLASHAVRLYHAGGKPVKRSTLSDANAQRPSGLFGALFALLVGQAQRGLRRDLANLTYVIDATSLPLSGLSGWARFSAGVCGAKLHVIYDPDADRPIYASVSPAKVNDITAAKDMPIVPGATYVFDLGYYDYAWWAALDAAQCRIVTRLKKNTPLAVIEELAVPAGSNILSDRIGFLPGRQARSRRNPMQGALREIRARTETGKVLRILSNDLDASAAAIAALYKRRWAIELLFRWIKQTLRIKHFIGTSENAVRIQIFVALIAFMLLRLAQATQQAIKSPLQYFRLVRANLMQRRRIDRLLEPEPEPVLNPAQLVLQWT
jgi:IS4 transposase